MRFATSLTPTIRSIAPNRLYRADQMARQLGLSPALIPASTEYPILLASYTLREILAVWKFHLFGG